MKNVILSIALGACLAAPAFAAAPQTYTFAGNSDSESVDFTVGGKNVGKDVLVNASWNDMHVGSNSFNGVLNWVLSGGASRTGSLVDGAGKAGQSFINLSGLSAGDYKLTFTGIWGSEKITARNGSELELHQGSVNLGEHVQFANHVPAVPEPETYALMLAGLGMIGTVARRRKLRASAV